MVVLDKINNDVLWQGARQWDVSEDSKGEISADGKKFAAERIKKARKLYSGEKFNEYPDNILYSQNYFAISTLFLLDVVRDRTMPLDLRRRAIYVLCGSDRWSGYQIVKGELEALAKETTDPLHDIFLAKLD